MFAYSIIYIFLNNVFNCYFELKHPKVQAYIQNLLQKKAAEVELACFENSKFYDIYVKAIGEAANRAYAVMNNILDIVWITIETVAIGTLIITIDPIFLLFTFSPLLCTLLIGKRRNRIQYDYNMKNQELERQREYVLSLIHISPGRNPGAAMGFCVSGCRGSVLNGTAGMAHRT